MELKLYLQMLLEALFLFSALVLGWYLTKPKNRDHRIITVDGQEQPEIELDNRDVMLKNFLNLLLDILFFLLRQIMADIALDRGEAFNRVVGGENNRFRIEEVNGQQSEQQSTGQQTEQQGVEEVNGQSSE